MDKVYVLAIDNKDDDWFDTIDVRVFKDKDKAFETARKVVEEFENEISDLDGYVIESHDKYEQDSFYYSYYEDGYYSTNHYDVYINLIDIE